MSAVNVTNVAVLDNPSMFQNPFQFEISYECLTALQDGENSTSSLFVLMFLEFLMVQDWTLADSWVWLQT